MSHHNKAEDFFDGRGTDGYWKCSNSFHEKMIVFIIAFCRLDLKIIKWLSQANPNWCHRGSIRTSKNQPKMLHCNLNLRDFTEQIKKTVQCRHQSPYDLFHTSDWSVPSLCRPRWVLVDSGCVGGQHTVAEFCKLSLANISLLKLSLVMCSSCAFHWVHVPFIELSLVRQWEKDSSDSCLFFYGAPASLLLQEPLVH